MTEGQIKRARGVWGAKVLEVLREDPYRLADEVHGFGFQRADLIARKMGLPHDHPRRVQACLVYLLGCAEGEGHCYVLRGTLIAKAAEGLRVGLSSVAAELAHVIEEKRIIESASGRLYLPDTFRAESTIVDAVSRFVARSAA